MPQLSDFYDGDARRTNPAVRDLAAKIRIPHPLSNVQYADGIHRCTHSKNHQRFDYCPQRMRPAPAPTVQWAECGNPADHPAHSFQNGGPEDGDECRGWGALRVELELDTTAAATDDPPF